MRLTFKDNFKLTTPTPLRGGLKKKESSLKKPKKVVFFSEDLPESKEPPTQNPAKLEEPTGRIRRTRSIRFADDTIDSASNEEKKVKQQPILENESIENKLRGQFSTIDFGNKDPFTLVASMNNPHFCSKVKVLYKRLSLSEKNDFLDKFLPLCIKKTNIAMLSTLQQSDEQQGLSILKNKLSQLDLPEQQHTEKMLWASKTDSGFIKKILSQFSGFGNIKIDGSRLICAQIGNRETPKPYDFNPTILEPENFREYLDILKASSHRPITERFTIAGSHWITGAIELKADGSAAIAFIDSLGLKVDDNLSYINQ